MNNKRTIINWVLLTLLVAFILPAFGVLSVSEDLTINLTVAAGFAGVVVGVRRAAINVIAEHKQGKTTPGGVLGCTLLNLFSPSLLLLLVDCLLPTFITVRIGLWGSIGLSLGLAAFDSLVIRVFSKAPHK